MPRRRSNWRLIRSTFRRSAKLQAAIADNPDDYQSRLDLAVVLNSSGQRDDALDNLLYIVRKKRDWNDDAARRATGKILRGLGSQG